MIVEVNYGLEDALRDAGIYHERVAAPRIEGTLRFAKKQPQVLQVRGSGGGRPAWGRKAAALTSYRILEAGWAAIRSAGRGVMCCALLCSAGEVGLGGG